MWPSGLTLAILTLNFHGQIWNLLYLSQKWSDCRKTKSKHVKWLLASNITKCMGLTDQGFSWSNFEIALSQEWEGRLTLSKGDGSRSFMTMAVTFWWSSWGVSIYRIVTGWLQMSACRRLKPRSHLAVPWSRPMPTCSFPTTADLTWVGRRRDHSRPPDDNSRLF